MVEREHPRRGRALGADGRLRACLLSAIGVLPQLLLATAAFGQVPEIDPATQRVKLGTSGSITLRLRDGGWAHGEMRVSDGTTVTATNGNSYTLRFHNGSWTAEFTPEGIAIEGTEGLIATRSEDRLSYKVGTNSRLGLNGRGDVVADGKMYRVREESGKLVGERFDFAPHGSTSSEGNFYVRLQSGHARLTEDSRDTARNESGTMLEVGRALFPMNRLLEHGAASFQSPRTIVSEARDEISSLRRTANVLISALGDDENYEEYLAKELAGLWTRVVRVLRSVFGDAVSNFEVVRAGVGSAGDYDRIVKALGDRGRFVRATQDVDGVFFRSADGTLPETDDELFEAGEQLGTYRPALSSRAARRIFGSRAVRSSATFEVLGGTRYGTVVTSARVSGYATKRYALRGSGHDLGAFAYSTIPATRNLRQIGNHADAYYYGNTLAVSGDGKRYRGEIELRVRFVNRSVHGLVTDLVDEGRQPWTFQSEQVRAIHLPEARLRFGAGWAVTSAGERTQAWIRTENSFPGLRLTPIQSSFAGQLLGAETLAGSEAVGAWSIGGGSLSGGFGAIRRESEETTEPSNPTAREGVTAEQAASSVLPTGTEIHDGMLILRGTKWGPNISTAETELDDEVQILDESRKIEESLQLSLTDALARRGSVAAYEGENLVRATREQLARLRAELSELAGLAADSYLLQARLGVWERIRDLVGANLFGTAAIALGGPDYANDAGVPAQDPRKWSNGYPVHRSGHPDDATALRELGAILEAMATPTAFVRALDEGLGVFGRDDGAPLRSIRDREIDAVWNRVGARILLTLESTDLTRFGAWRKQTAPNPFSDYHDRLENDENGPNSFAYSILGQANYFDPEFPAGGSARYRGKTVAVQRNTFYRGTFNLTASWHERVQGIDQVGTLEATISGLSTEVGNALEYSTIDDTATESKTISTIRFGSVPCRIDANGLIYFSDKFPSQLTLQFERIAHRQEALAGEPALTAGINGKFVGATGSGPRAAIGTWMIRYAAAHRIGTGDPIFGSFGSEVIP